MKNLFFSADTMDLTVNRIYISQLLALCIYMNDPTKKQFFLVFFFHIHKGKLFPTCRNNVITRRECSSELAWDFFSRGNPVRDIFSILIFSMPGNNLKCEYIYVYLNTRINWQFDFLYSMQVSCRQKRDGACTSSRIISARIPSGNSIYIVSFSREYI